MSPHIVITESVESDILFGVINVLKKYDEATEWEKKASKRRDAMMRYCWAESKGMFFDFNAQKYKQTSVVSAAAAYPLYFKMLSKRNAIE